MTMPKNVFVKQNTPDNIYSGHRGIGCRGITPCLPFINKPRIDNKPPIDNPPIFRIFLTLLSTSRHLSLSLIVFK